MRQDVGDKSVLGRFVLAIGAGRAGREVEVPDRAERRQLGAVAFGGELPTVVRTAQPPGRGVDGAGRQRHQPVRAMMSGSATMRPLARNCAASCTGQRSVGATLAPIVYESPKAR